MSNRFRLIVVLLAFLAAGPGVPSAQTPGAGAQVYAVIYSRGPAWKDDASVFANPAVKAHVQYFTALAEKLIGAAPFELNAGEPTVGMVLMLSESATAARAWAENDPAVKAQVMTTKVLRWRVTGLKEYRAGGF